MNFKLTPKAFQLTPKEIEKFDKWKENLPNIDVPIVIGGEFGFVFKFTPTGLGITKTVERIYDGETFDFTDYDCW